MSKILRRSPITIRRICDLLPYKTVEGAKGIINCEDEPYIAVGLGCAIGVMRHPFAGFCRMGHKILCFLRSDVILSGVWMKSCVVSDGIG